MINSLANYLIHKVASAVTTQPTDKNHQSADVGPSNAAQSCLTDSTASPDGNSDWVLINSDGLEARCEHSQCCSRVHQNLEAKESNMNSSDTFFPDVNQHVDYPPIEFPLRNRFSRMNDSSDFGEELDHTQGPSINVIDIDLQNDAGALSDASSQPEMVYNPSCEECWLMTPAPCFTGTPGEDGADQVTSGSLENLLIEHPSMSVYELRGRRPLNSSQARLLQSRAIADFSSRESLVMASGGDTNYNSIMESASVIGDPLRADRNYYDLAVDQQMRADRNCYDSSAAYSPWLADSESSSMNNSFTAESSNSSPETGNQAEGGNRSELQQLVPALLGASPRKKSRKGGIGKGHSNLSRAALDRRNKCLTDSQTLKLKYHPKNQWSSGPHTSTRR